MKTTFEMSRRRAQQRGRGFTLVELMVAMTGAIFISVVVFTLSRDATKFFQSELRVSEATVSTVIGFERLRQDLARAAFLASPNLARDVNKCPRGPSGGVAAVPSQGSANFAITPGLTQMGLAQIQADTKVAVTGNPQMTLNGLTPDTITMWGNYTSSDQFPVRTPELAINRLHLEPDSPAMLRHGMSSTAPLANNNAILPVLFPAGRILRVVDGTNREQYALITSAQWAGTDPQIDIDPLITLVQKASNPVCGIRGVGADLAVNPVNIVRYELDTLAANANYSGLYQGSAPAYDANRLELVRNELDPTNLATILDTELIAEYAVDLKFGLTVLSNSGTGILTYLPEDHASIPNYAGVTTNGSDAGQAGFFGPQMIRGIHARLVVRQRLADRETAIVPGGTPDQLFRVRLVDNAAPVPDEYARTRTLRSHVATRNTRNSIWN